LDSIPGLVALLAPDGSLEFGNHHIVEFTGRTLEELKRWGTSDIVHAEDLPHVIRVFEQSQRQTFLPAGNGFVPDLAVVPHVDLGDAFFRRFDRN